MVHYIAQDRVDIAQELTKAREAPLLLRHAARHAWAARWWAIVGVGVQRAVGGALLVGRGAVSGGRAVMG